MKGKKHKAINDCRHQIAYLGRVRNTLMALNTGRKGVGKSRDFIFLAGEQSHVEAKACESRGPLVYSQGHPTRPPVFSPDL
jgi:hypothetical protein